MSLCTAAVMLWWPRMEVSPEEIPGRRDKAAGRLWGTAGIPRGTQETQLSLETRASSLERREPKPGTGRRR